MKRETEEDKRCGRKKDEKWLENWKGYEQQIQMKEEEAREVYPDCGKKEEKKSKKEKRGRLR